MFKNLDRAKQSLENYVKAPQIQEGAEKNYHVIQANQTMNEAYRQLADDRYMIIADSYLVQLKEYWKAKDPNFELKVHYTVNIHEKSVQG